LAPGNNYKSKPKLTHPNRYTIPKNYHGITSQAVMRAYVPLPFLQTHQLTPPPSGILAGGFGGVAGFFALFFFAEVPRVREDIMKKVPVLGSYFNVEIPPEDNPF
jgi:hypothetical protein